MYLKLKEFNLEKLYVYNCLNVLKLFLILSVWEKNSHKLLLILACILNEKILFKKLVWKELFFFVREAYKKLQLNGCFRDEFNTKFAWILNVNSVFSLYKFFSSMPYKLKFKLNKKTQKFKNIFSLISSVKNLQKSWYEIKNNFLNLNSYGSENNKIWTNLELEWFKKLSKKLNSGFYKYKFTKQFSVEKWSKINKKVFIMGSFRDKIIEKSILWVLQQIYEGASFWEPVDYKTFKTFKDFNFLRFGTKFKRIKMEKGKKIYEVKKWILWPIFNNNLFGFRPNRSVHWALKTVKQSWSPVVWFWSVDIIRAFNDTSYHKLIHEIKKKIDDPKLISEIFKMVKVKIINFTNTNNEQYWKASVLSLFLFNVYLSFLDNHIDKLRVKFGKKSAYIQNIKFWEFTFMNQKKFKWNDVIRSGISTTIKTEFVIKVNYIRYANDMLFGFNMDKKLAKKIIKNIHVFMKSNDSFSIAESRLIHGVSELATFLGFKIGCYPIKYNRKSEHLTRFYKLIANVWRKKIAELEKYFKMQELILSKVHREVVHSIAKIGQTLVKESFINITHNNKIKIKVIRLLKKSLIDIEAEIVSTPLVSRIPKQDKKCLNYLFGLAEQKRLNFLKYITQKWIKKAQDLANKENYNELQTLTKKYLSSKFIKARDNYLQELNSIVSWDFSEKTMEYTFKKAKSSQANKIQKLHKTDLNYRSIRILFPKKDFVKKLWNLKVLHKVKTKPVGVGFLASLEDYEIIRWFSLKAYAIWNYYSCSDNIWDVKNILNWVLRYSLLGTLAMKHKSTIKQSIQKYSSSPGWTYSYMFNKKIKKITLIKYPTLEYFNNKKKEFKDTSLTPTALEKILNVRFYNASFVNIISLKKKLFF